MPFIAYVLWDRSKIKGETLCCMLLFPPIAKIKQIKPIKKTYPIALLILASDLLLIELGLYFHMRMQINTQSQQSDRQCWSICQNMKVIFSSFCRRLFFISTTKDCRSADCWKPQRSASVEDKPATCHSHHKWIGWQMYRRGSDSQTLCHNTRHVVALKLWAVPFFLTMFNTADFIWSLLNELYSVLNINIEIFFVN